MSNVTEHTQPAMKYDAVVQSDGQIVLTVPFAPGNRVVIFVIQVTDDDDTFQDLAQAASSSLAFWDTPFDDEDWNTTVIR